MSAIASDTTQRFRAIYLAPDVPEAVVLSHTPQLTLGGDGVYAVTLLDGNGIPNPDETHTAIAVIRLLRLGLVIIETEAGFFVLPESDVPHLV